MDGLKITVEYIWADSHYEKVLICIEHLDKSPFTGPGQSYFGQGYGRFGEVALKNKKEYEAYSLQQKKFRTLEKLLAEDATITEIVKAYAAIDSNYKKFIRKDGTVDKAGAEAAIDAEFEAASTEISVLKECNVKEDMPYKKHFILNGGQKNTRTAGPMVLHLGKYREMAETDIDITPALIGYLSTQPAKAQTKKNLSSSYKETV